MRSRAMLSGWNRCARSRICSATPRNMANMAGLFIVNAVVHWGDRIIRGKTMIKLGLLERGGLLGLASGALHAELIDEPLVNLSVDGGIWRLWSVTIEWPGILPLWFINRGFARILTERQNRNQKAVAFGIGIAIGVAIAIGLSISIRAINH